MSHRMVRRHCAFICELVRNGYIGALKEIEVLAPSGYPATGSGNPAPQATPAAIQAPSPGAH